MKTMILFLGFVIANLSLGNPCESQGKSHYAEEFLGDVAHVNLTTQLCKNKMNAWDNLDDDCMTEKDRNELSNCILF